MTPRGRSPGSTGKVRHMEGEKNVCGSVLSVCTDLKQGVRRWAGRRWREKSYFTHNKRGSVVQRVWESLYARNTPRSPNISVIDPVEPSIPSTASNRSHGLCFSLIKPCYNSEPQQEFLCFHGQRAERALCRCLKTARSRAVNVDKHRVCTVLQVTGSNNMWT